MTCVIKLFRVIFNFQSTCHKRVWYSLDEKKTWEALPTGGTAICRWTFYIIFFYCCEWAIDCSIIHPWKGMRNMIGNGINTLDDSIDHKVRQLLSSTSSSSRWTSPFTQHRLFHYQMLIMSIDSFEAVNSFVECQTLFKSSGRLWMIHLLAFVLNSKLINRRFIIHN